MIKRSVKKLINNLGINKIIFFLVLFLIPILSNAQNDIITSPIKPLNKLIKYSNATIVNNLPYDGILYGYIDTDREKIKEYLAFDTFYVELKDFDSIQVYSEYVRDGQNIVNQKYFLKVEENQRFEFLPIPIKELINGEIRINHKIIYDYYGEKLYSIMISDDVDPDRIIVSATSESLPFIDIIKIDNSDMYQINLKNEDEFEKNITQEMRSTWNGKIVIPIGVELIDPFIPEPKVPLPYSLVKEEEKKPRKKSKKNN